METPLACPFCSYKGLIKEYIKYSAPQQPNAPMQQPMQQPIQQPMQQPVQRPMQNTRQQDMPEATVMMGPNAFIKCIDSGVERNLKPGQNIIGRTAQPPKAHIMFDDPNKHMGRQHAVIDVQMKNNMPIFLLRDLNSLNGTFVNQVKVTNGAIVKLMPGTVFKLADMSFTIRIAGSMPAQIKTDSGNNGETQLY